MPSPFPGMDPYIESRRIWSDFHHGLADEIRAQLNAQIESNYYASVAPLETPVRLANVEVHEAGSDVLVTAIEILSPINKRPGRERQKYLRKRRELLHSEIHAMELDLLRGGERSPLEIPPPPAPYYITLARADNRPYVDVWPIQLEGRLPVLPMPLLAPDPDVPLDLGAIMQTVYERGGYTTRIDYRQPVPLPPLEPEQQAWVEQLLAAL